MIECLQGVRVADFGQLTAGANTSAMLADLGAEVIKIEAAAHLDLFRLSTQGGPSDWWNNSPQFHFTNRNKLGVSLDLKHPEGLRLARQLVGSCDVLVENYRRGVLDNLGLGYAAIAALNPRIVYASISSQGETGPHRMHRTFGSTLDAMGGLASLTRYEDGGPQVSGADFNYPDQIVSLAAAGFILAGVLESRQTGRGAHLDISQREIASFLIGEEIVAASSTPVSERAYGNAEAGLLLQDCFASVDGRWVAITVKDEAESARLRQALGIGLGDLASWCASKPSAEILRAVGALGIVAAPVNTGNDLLGAADVVGQSLAWTDDGTLIKGAPYTFDGLPFAAARKAPALGEHTRQVLMDILGLDDDALDDLERMGVTSTKPKEG